MRTKLKTFWVLLIVFCSAILISETLRLNLNKNFPKESWVGEYSFFECYPSESFDVELSRLPSIMRGYSINIYSDGGSLIAKIKIEGYQTYKLLIANVSINQNEAMFLFDGEYEEMEAKRIFSDIYEKDVVLLTLRRQNKDLITEWGLIKPMKPEHEVSGKYFVKG